MARLFVQLKRSHNRRQTVSDFIVHWKQHALKSLKLLFSSYALLHDMPASSRVTNPRLLETYSKSQFFSLFLIRKVPYCNDKEAFCLATDFEASPKKSVPPLYPSRYLFINVTFTFTYQKQVPITCMSCNSSFQCNAFCLQLVWKRFGYTPSFKQAIDGFWTTRRLACKLNNPKINPEVLGPEYVWIPFTTTHPRFWHAPAGYLRLIME